MNSVSFIQPEAVLEHWQAHRRLTRKFIEAFPEEQLYTFSVGGMRPFGFLVQEMLDIAVPMLKGIVTHEWTKFQEDKSTKPKAELLRQWDEDTQQINTFWAKLRPEQFNEHVVAFGEYPGLVRDQILYAIDNEIHHRGQASVYLRALRVSPPAFFDRS